MKLDAILILALIVAVVSYLAPGGIIVGIFWAFNIALAAHRAPLVGKGGLFSKN